MDQLKDLESSKARANVELENAKLELDSIYKASKKLTVENVSLVWREQRFYEMLTIFCL
jgi:hypothetical protein